MKSFVKTVVSLLIIVISFLGCTSSYDPAESRRVWAEKGRGDIVFGVAYAVAAIDSTTGYWNGIQLAVDEINKQSGINGRKLKLIKMDDKGSVTTGAAVAQTLAENPEVAAVIGHWNSRVSIPAAAIYEKAEVVMITPATTSPELTEKGYHYVFRQILDDTEIGREMAVFASEKGYKRIAVYYAEDEYGRGLANSFEDAAKGMGIKVVDRTSSFGMDTSFDRLLEKWHALGFDAVFVADVMPNGGVFVEQLRKAGVDVPVLGATGLDRSSFVEMLGRAGDGTVVPTLFNAQSDKQLVNKFVEEYQMRYKTTPDVWAAQGYETVKLLAYAIDQADSAESSRIADVLHSLEDWEGITGVLSFDITGRVSGKVISKKVVRNGQFEYLNQ